nr:putative clathrin assembly protein At1g25240 [Ipomoea batatas]
MAWKWASGVLKDQNSIFLTSLIRKTMFRNPTIEAIVIKATRHDEYSTNHRYVDRLYEWICLSPNHLTPIVCAITLRVEKTRSWEVALKGLMLMHRVMCFDIVAVNMVGRLPFNLSSFTDGHSNPEEAWCLNAFVRSYFAFLDHKSIILFENSREDDCYKTKSSGHQLSHFAVSHDLNMLRNLQGLLDILLQVKPHSEIAAVPLVVETMDMIMVEIYNIYHQICITITRVLLRIYMVGKIDAKIALQIVQKATLQGEALALYYEFCIEHGLITNLDCPKVKQIPEEDIRELEDIIKGPSLSASSPTNDNLNKSIVAIKEQEKETTTKSKLKTVITNHWETFDDYQMVLTTTCNANNVHVNSHQDLPDLISFLNLL